jgi:predicted RNase H-like nuclease
LDISAPSEQLIAGVDGCKAGWILVSHPKGQRADLNIAVFSTFAEIAAHLPRETILGIDMPIGLPGRVEAGGRRPDRAARLVLGPRRSSVFSVPSRRAIYAFDAGYPACCAIARDTSTPPWAPSKQAFWLFPRIQQVDLALRADASRAAKVYEVHPEVSFRTMNGAPLAEPKKKQGRCHSEGMELRTNLLAQAGFPRAFLEAPPPRGAGRDDLLDACAVAWSAARIQDSCAEVYPADDIEWDEFHLRVAIWA